MLKVVRQKVCFEYHPEFKKMNNKPNKLFNTTVFKINSQKRNL